MSGGTFASPDYLGHFGTPQTPAISHGHEMVGLLSPDSGDIVPLVFGTDGNAHQPKLAEAAAVILDTWRAWSRSKLQMMTPRPMLQLGSVIWMNGEFVSRGPRKVSPNPLLRICYGPSR